LGKYPESNDCFNQIVKTNSEDFSTWNSKGLVFHGLKKYLAAVKCYEKALSINPNFTDCWYNKGASLRALGKRNESEECFEKYQKLRRLNNLSKQPNSGIFSTVK
jgi:tetratricopeptide (TPR) repeat protein